MGRKDKAGSGQSDPGSQTDQTPKEPARYSLYAGLKGKVSLRTMDIVIYTIVGLLLVVVFVGIFGK